MRKNRRTYTEDRKASLSNYKVQNITAKPGYWRNYPKEYHHILPDSEKEKNILEPIQAEFWNYHTTQKFKIHNDFRHLNSSQALCFNLFFPLFYYEVKNLEYVLKHFFHITRKGGMLCKFDFERIIDKKEATNFDFFIEDNEGYKIAFEIKYTEDKFKDALPTKGRIKKFETIYKSKLAKLLHPEFINEKFVFENYQIIRNISYIDDFTTVVFLIPEGNSNLTEVKNICEKILLQDAKVNVRIVLLENLVEEILSSNLNEKLITFYKLFKSKYIDIWPSS